MSDFITIAYYNGANPRDILLKSTLEEMGIPCFIKNQFGYSRKGNAPELQINISDFEKALPVLKDLGCSNFPKMHRFPLVKMVGDLTENMVLLNRLSVEMRFLIASIFIICILSIGIYYFLA